MPVSRLALTDFRSYASALIEPGPGFVLLFGENGAGKTNLLEAVSLLTPGRGLRGAPLAKWRGKAAAALSRSPPGLGEIDIGTGTARNRARAAAGADQRRSGLGELACANGCRCCG